MAQQLHATQRTPAEAQALTMLFEAHRDGDTLLIETAMRSLEFLDAIARLNLPRRYNNDAQNQEAHSQDF